MTSPDTDPNDRQQAATVLTAAFARLLRPLVRLAMRYGVTYPVAADLLKRTYLEVAESDLARDAAPATDSRVSLLTGIHRKYVKQLRAVPRSQDAAAPKQVALGSQIAAAWLHRTDYRDASGEPRSLPRQSSAPDAPSFEALVTSISRDIHPRVILDEWLRLGVVSVDGTGEIRLVRSAFVPVAGFDEKAHFLGRNVHDHLAAAASNLSGIRPPFLERSVHYEGLNDTARHDLTGVAEQAAMRALQAVNDRVLAGGAGAYPDERQWRINFGVYFYAEPQEGTDQAADPATASADRGDDAV